MFHFFLKRPWWWNVPDFQMRVFTGFSPIYIILNWASLGSHKRTDFHLLTFFFFSFYLVSPTSALSVVFAGVFLLSALSQALTRDWAQCPQAATRWLKNWEIYSTSFFIIIIPAYSWGIVFIVNIRQYKTHSYILLSLICCRAFSSPELKVVPEGIDQ